MKTMRSYNSNQHFRVKKIEYIDNGVLQSYKYIALVDDNTGLVTEYTNYADYVLYCKHQDLRIGNKDNGALYTVCQFLNDLFINPNKSYNVSSIEEITREIFSEWLNDYAHSSVSHGKHPLEGTINLKRNVISTFLYGLCMDNDIKMKNLKASELISYSYVITPEKQKIIRPQYLVKIRYFEKERAEKRIWRDMPFSIVERFIKFSQIHDPELTFAIVLMAFTGIREGEVCNLRRKDSCYGPGIIMRFGQPLIDSCGSEISSVIPCEAIELDLKETLVLRSDNRQVGSIKRPRMQPVFGLFVETVFNYYIQHLKLIEKKPCERYRPLFLNKQKGKGTDIYPAMTKKAFQQRINRLFYNHVLPSLENDADPTLREFYQIMQNHSWGAHSFRHWYTVLLVLCGVDEVTLQTFRGDRSPDSARVYLERKGELKRIYCEASEKLGKMIRWEQEDND